MKSAGKANRCPHLTTAAFLSNPHCWQHKLNMDVAASALTAIILDADSSHHIHMNQNPLLLLVTNLKWLNTETL